MDVPLNDELIQKIRAYALASEKPSRFAHSERVAETSRALCGRYGLDATRGYIAGLAHDICKDLGNDLICALAHHDGKPFSSTETENPSLLHGRAAAIKLRTDFGVSDPEILEAVACHTLGGTCMGPLAKVVYVADKIEPGRPQSTEAYRARLEALDLDTLCLTVLKENIEHLRTHGKTPAPESSAFLLSLENSLAHTVPNGGPTQ
ncbi:MAG: bis(5'-nucleosyl)-tetraphosphatase (symmetrical) YqeK [Treponema sp.]|nr:bis(5'-nucleosyl)-tetraphosphatase (symmetrical) YqeK [Treponema sp.]